MKFNLKIVLFITVLTGLNNLAKAQYIQDGQGHEIKGSEYTEYQGQPYINADWAKGTAKLKDGSVQNDIMLKYDQIKGELYVQGKDNTVVQFNQPVSEFTITVDGGKTAHFSIFPGNGLLPDNAFAEVLADGNTKLLKRNAKSISESKDGIGTAVITRTVVDNIDYYLLLGGKAQKVKRDKKSVELLLGNKQAELEAYIKTNNLNLKKDDDFAKLITYYNTL